MATRREFLSAVLAYGTLGLLTACTSGGGSLGGQPAPTAGNAPTTAPAGASANAAAGGTLTFALENDLIDFDPLRSRAFVDRNAHYQIYDSLVRIDADGKIIPSLAEKWDIAPDGKSITFSLRKGVSYHDGSPFDADSVKWNIDRYRTTEGSARKGELTQVSGVEVVDPSTVRFTLSTPFSPLLAQLVDRAGMMVSRKAVEAAGEDFTRKAFKAGTGPFILTEAVQSDHTTLERNPDYWDKDAKGNKLPWLDKVVIRPIVDPTVRLTNLKTGDAQIMNRLAGKDVALAKSDSSLNYQQRPGVAFDSLIPNRKSGFLFEESRYVKAVSVAIDRQEILDKVFLGVGAVAYGAVAPPHFAYDANFKPFAKADPDSARQLVQEVGKGPLSFEFMVTAGDSEQLQLAQLIQSQLKRADIDAQLVQLQFAEILDQQQKHVFKGLSQIGWSGRIDPDGNIYDQLHTGGPQNDSSYSDTTVDQLLDQQRADSEPDKRKDSLRKAEQIYVVDDPARVWYRFRVSEVLAAKSVQGVSLYPDGIIRFQYISLQK